MLCPHGRGKTHQGWGKRSEEKPLCPAIGQETVPGSGPIEVSTAGKGQGVSSPGDLLKIKAKFSCDWGKDH